MLETSLFHAASRFPRAKQDLNHPANAVILNDLTHLLQGLDRQRRHQHPFHRRLPRPAGCGSDTSTTFTVTAGRDEPRADAGSLWPRGTSTSGGRLARAHASRRVFTRGLRLPLPDRDLLREQHRLGQDAFAHLGRGGFGFHAAIATGANQPVHRPHAAGFGEQLVDIRIAVGEPDDLGLRQFLGELACRA